MKLIELWAEVPNKAGGVEKYRKINKGPYIYDVRMEGEGGGRKHWPQIADGCRWRPQKKDFNLYIFP